MEIRGYHVEHRNLMWLLHRMFDWLAVLLGAVFVVELLNDTHWGNSQLYTVLIIGFLFTVVVYPIVGVYRPWRGEPRLKEVGNALGAWILSMSFTVVSIQFLEVDQALYTLFIGVWCMVGSAVQICARIIVRQWLNYLRGKGRNLRHVIVVGDGHVADAAIRQVNSAKWTGYKLSGYFGDNYLDTSTKNLGDFNDVEKYCRDNSVDQIWIAMGLHDARVASVLIEQLKFVTADVRYIPDLTGFNLINHSVSSVAGMPVINVSTSPMKGVNQIIKDIEDKIIASIILLLISPVMIGLAVAVKVTSPGPIFYRQERVSWNGKPFEMLKFRSMAVDSEADGVQWGGAQSMKVTPIGKFIRATSLDELPQFINVLKGDMSIVGPRPERTVFVEQFKHEIPGYMQKHMVKAGITGLAQIEGWRGDTDLSKRVESDLNYIRNWSLWLDLKIIFLTVFKGFVNKNAY
ncbi:undecaprenyl-phosphate glucose phosphotransferase [Ferrimonas pelagia]|uniref:Undecaprenyl-phosphate glucose phosphotransferase n=1 Tax=Ferrimonas pelagia TaxID=1177826 RepID=A0ABP9EEQ1_9GAMM